MPELRIRALSRSFKNGDTVVHAVRNLDLTIPEGEFTVIVGRSGCGKTTLLRLISGLETPDSGEVFFTPPQAVPQGTLINEPRISGEQGTGNGEQGFTSDYANITWNTLINQSEILPVPCSPSLVPQPPSPPFTSRFGFMFQDARLLPWLSVEENLRLAFPPLPRAPWRDKAQTAAARQGATGAFNFAFGKGKAIQARQGATGAFNLAFGKGKAIQARQGATGAFNLSFGKGKAIQARQEMDGTIDRLLTLVGLEGWKKASPRRLSGGMAQRVALVRALCRNPRILLLDEPFGALDAFTRSQLREDMDRLWHTMKRTVLLVTHDIEEAVHLADRVLLMKEGRIAGELAVPLARPRQRRSAEFQALCRKLESRME